MNILLDYNTIKDQNMFKYTTGGLFAVALKNGCLSMHQLWILNSNHDIIKSNGCIKSITDNSNKTFDIAHLCENYINHPFLVVQDFQSFVIIYCGNANPQGIPPSEMLIIDKSDDLPISIGLDYNSELKSFEVRQFHEAFIDDCPELSLLYISPVQKINDMNNEPVLVIREAGPFGYTDNLDTEFTFKTDEIDELYIA